MAEFRLIRSNDLVHLGTFLSARLIAEPLQDPIQPEVIAIGYRGIAPWLTREITQSIGVGANLDYPFQSRAITEALRGLYREAVDPRLAAENPWTANTMTWAIADLLPSFTQDPCFQPLRRYLETGPQEPDLLEHRRIDLATQIATIFDRYLMYRPDWVLAWGKGETAPRLELSKDQAWQPVLWHALTQRFGETAPHLAQILSTLTPETLTAIDPDPIRESLDLHRLSIFGLNALPKTLLLALQALSHVIDVDLYVFSPSDTYWADIRSGDALRQQFLYDHEGYNQAFSEQFDTAHPLLLSLGRSARDFQHLLLEQLDQGLEDFTQKEAFVHQSPRSDAALHHLQADLQGVLLNEAPHRLSPDDASLQVHACHGAARQVEVLKESLLHLLNQDPTLEPRDIVVLCPDLETYAPILGSVFESGSVHHDPTTGWGHDGVPTLEYRFADLSMRRLNPVAEALMRILELAQSRLSIDDVMSLLSLDAVQRRFGFQPNDLEDIQRALDESDIRWGMDASHRTREGQPADRAFTWEEGLTQLALGAAMSDEGMNFQSDTFYAKPMDSVEGDRFELIGKCLHFSTNLFEILRSLQVPAPLSSWADRILNLLDWLTETPEQADFLKRRCIDVLNELQEAAALSGSTPDASLTLEAIELLLRGRFDVAYSSGRSSLHAIQCSNFQSLRGIPARVVVLLGMDDGSFPRQSVRSSMDLTNAPRWIGDSDPREEERGALLDAILAARDHLLIFYTGRDKQTHEALEPAAPIRELLDAIDLTFESSQPETKPSDAITKVHPLHRFSTDNYQAEKPWSFSQRGLQASRVFHSAAFKVREPLGIGPGQAKERELRTKHFSPSELSSWLLKPQRMYAHTVLRIKPFDSKAEAKTREPINLSAFEYAEVGTEFLGGAALLLGEPRSEDITVDRRAFSLPLGAPGELTFEALTVKLKAAQERYDALTSQATKTVVVPDTLHACEGNEDFSLACPGFTYYQGETETYLPTLSTGFNNETFYFNHWLTHLMGIAQTRGKLQATYALLVTHNDDALIELHFEVPGKTDEERLAYANAELTKLLALTHQAQEKPLLLFKKTSFKAIEALLKHQASIGLGATETSTMSDFDAAAVSKAFTAAKNTWGKLSAKEGSYPECQDATLKTLYKGSLPFISPTRNDDFNDDFFETSLKLWLPVILNMRTGDAS